MPQIAVYNTWHMQRSHETPSVTLSATNAAHIAGLLERCAAHEEERARGKINFPLIVMRSLALEAHHWARFLQSELSMMHPARASSKRPANPGAPTGR